jgi:hypothetical protein
VVFPALALLITTLAFNLLGDGIRDAMDPRTERILAASRARRGRRKKRTAATAALGGPSKDFPDPPRQAVGR